ncbi:sulfatase [Engelhardtia mirabilis]|uniref:Choline-sulfatase n=1 Tax=Engelhardtia mirabilis TaxID=2528011 RepID=A0A518BLE5_9BACT|nr:Choline-sulfatase [Planctomycetes bacterium Pla133]QDV02099.1 Choline-sulfatase [Planctomycetes bacterium Pla86]
MSFALRIVVDRVAGRTTAIAAGAIALALGLVACGGTSAPIEPGAYAGKNVIVTLVDAASAAHMSVYGYERPTTPFLEELARQAIVFDDVTASAPYTLASVASLMVGEHVDVHRVAIAGDPLPTDVGLLAEGFDQAGYRSLALSTNAHVHERFGFARGFEQFDYIDPLVGSTPFHQVPELLLEKLDAFLEQPRERPFFAYVHLMPPHAPYDPPPDLRGLFADGSEGREGDLDFLIALSAGVRRPTPQERQRVCDLYDGGMRYADRILARIAASLERSGVLEETLWVVLSDHGEAFGEQGIWQHSKLVQERMLRVPLILRLPGAAHGGQHVAEPVSLVDIHPTLVELCGLDLDPRSTSVSLLPLIDGRELPRRPALIARTAGPGPLTSIRRGRWKATYRSQERTWLLHDVEADFDERDDRSADEPEVLLELQAELQAWWQRWRPTAASRQRIELTDELRAHLEALGYRDLPEDE